MTATATELHPCAGGCGEMVRGTWKRGHKAKYEAHGSCAGAANANGGGNLAQRLGLLPGPDADDDELDDFVLNVTGPPLPPEDGDDEGGEDEIRPDPPPRHIDPPRGRSIRPATGKGRTVRVTATIRKDIEAKIGIMLEVPGRVWAARDPACGVAFVEAIPDRTDGQVTIPGIRTSVTELVCQSSDLVAFFTGAGGGFMLWLNLVMALQPVAFMVYGHHIAHTIELRPVDRQTVNPAAYAA